MIDAPHGRNLINGEWVATDRTFMSNPASGKAHQVFAGNAGLVDRAAQAAEEAFWSYGFSRREDRAAFLQAIANEIEARIEPITRIGSQETGLPLVRLQSEFGRTTSQLRLFARHIVDGAYLDRRVDPALPDRQPAPRPEIRMMQRPVGPVAVFGASNFPLAFSTAGGDTAAALAAGCPVLVKGHPAHPGTGEIVAEAILAAIKSQGIAPGVFSLIQGDDRSVGEALVLHPLVKAVGFTGSLAGGRALFDLCASRAEPIPFFGELGSVNPGFVLPAALDARAEEMGRGWAASLTMGAGQFCTKPGIAFVPAGDAGDVFVAAAADALAAVSPQTMLTDGIVAAFCAGKKAFDDSDVIRKVVANNVQGRAAGASLYEISGDAFGADDTLAEEIFGPIGLVVRVAGPEAMLPLAHGLSGQLTATLQIDDGDMPLAGRLLPVLERKAGRVLVNGYPTGVEVVDSMIHGGPYPASTNFGATSVGTLSIRRFLRPVAYQNVPLDLLPEDLAAFS
ncbi:aldehyde dehydrogenase (NADP(+)) [Oricola indica]|jgi:alpha-ketoglutaric semialdehyde dehydrogenase|uniref:aldehyde dehydrogenase (NADP(+)) n=1 Tax=Oricola indica TaxID=2872591 RepID=UPI001CC1203C|nr:aldehyde dehydrogenase (NADP(+)) [Oricola indica]